MVLALAVVLPVLYWNGGPETAGALKQAGIAAIEVAPERVAEWRGAAGIEVKAPTGQPGVKLGAPGVNYRIDEASASTAPWVDTNGAKILRHPGALFVYEVEGKTAALAAAEAYAFGGRAEIHTGAEGLGPLGAMLEFLRSVPEAEMPAAANIGFVDDGTGRAGEVMNLLVRRNLLYRIVRGPEAGLDMNVRIGSAEFPAAEADNPDMLAHKIRQELGDGKRLVRIYGSEVVIARLERSGGKARLHLLNYAGAKRNVAGLRVRVLGDYARAAVYADGIAGAKAQDFERTGGATEFTLAGIRNYAVVDLTR